MLSKGSILKVSLNIWNIILSFLCEPNIFVFDPGHCPGNYQVMSQQIILLESVKHMFYNFFNVNEKSVCKSFLKPSFLSEFSEECLTNLVYSFYYQVVSQFVYNFWHPWIVNSTECNTFFTGKPFETINIGEEMK